MIKGIIFDLDGVICETAKYHYLAWKKLANSLGFEFSEEQNEKMKGLSRVDSLDILLDIGGIIAKPHEKLKYAHVKNDWYVESLATIDRDVLLPGILSFLDHLRRNDIKCALGSASKNARIVLKSLDIEKYFQAIVDGNDVVKSKPDPEVFLKGSKLLGLDPSEIVVFEDSNKGLEAAKKGGFHTVGVGSKSNLTNTEQHISTFENFTMENIHILLEKQAVVNN